MHQQQRKPRRTGLVYRKDQDKHRELGGGVWMGGGWMCVCVCVGRGCNHSHTHTQAVALRHTLWPQNKLRSSQWPLASHPIERSLMVFYSGELAACSGTACCLATASGIQSTRGVHLQMGFRSRGSPEQLLWCVTKLLSPSVCQPLCASGPRSDWVNHGLFGAQM